MSRWTKLDEEKRLCNQWLKEPLINPETGHNIQRNGPTYNQWKKRCKELGVKSRPIATKEMTWRKCQEWRKNPDINPETGRKIEPSGPTYKRLEKQCKLILEKELVLNGDYYIPDKRGMVPCVVNHGTCYVVRTFDKRKVWGPLNKPVKKVQLVYYKDTWDYHYNHYKPVFVKGTPPRPRRQAEKGSKSNHMAWYQARSNARKKVNKNPKYVVDDLINIFIQPEEKGKSKNLYGLF